jgi:hypothetical protein
LNNFVFFNYACTISKSGTAFSRKEIFMKKFIKLTVMTMLMSNSATFYAAIGEKSEKTSEKKYTNIREAIAAHDAEAVKEFIKNGENVKGSNLVLEAISWIDRKPPYYDVYQYQPGTREVIQILLNAGANPNATYSLQLMHDDKSYPNTALCDVYNRIETLSHLIEDQDREELLYNLYDIAQDIKQAGGSCGFEMSIKSDSDRKIIDQKQAVPETQQVVEMFANPQLKRPLPRALIEGPIGQYLVIPMSAQQQERERIASEEEEKEKAAASTPKQTPAPFEAPQASKGLDDQN